jgi:hypothetical protein
MPNRRSHGKLEAKLVRQYVFKNCIKEPDIKDGEVRETVFTGTDEDAKSFVLAEIGEHRTGTIPDAPQGLVIHDTNGRGFYDNPLAL